MLRLRRLLGRFVNQDDRGVLGGGWLGLKEVAIGELGYRPQSSFDV